MVNYQTPQIDLQTKAKELESQIEIVKNHNVKLANELEETRKKLEFALGQISLIHNEYGDRMKQLNYNIWGMQRTLFHGSDPFVAPALNGQFSKQKIYMELIAEFNFSNIIETGTYLGKSTKFFAESRLPVTSIENNPEFLEQAKVHCHEFNNIDFIFGSSDDVLANITSEKFSKFLNLYYLDAHWEEYIPLRREIDIISRFNSNSIILIDDFKDPTDSGYEFDQYGDVILDLDYISDLISEHNIAVFFPNTPSNEDYCTIDIIGPRGTVLLASEPRIIQKLRSFSSISEYQYN